MDKDHILSAYPLLTETINDGLNRTRKSEDVLIKHKSLLLNLTPELREILFFKEERDHLQDLILRGLRIEKENGLPNQKNKPTIVLLLGYEKNKTIEEKTETLQSDKERITQKIQDLIVCTEGTGKSSQLCLGNWMTITLPADLKLEKEDNDIYTDAEFISELVTKGCLITEEVSEN